MHGPTYFEEENCDPTTDSCRKCEMASSFWVVQASTHIRVLYRFAEDSTFFRVQILLCAWSMMWSGWTKVEGGALEGSRVLLSLNAGRLQIWLPLARPEQGVRSKCKPLTCHCSSWPLAPARAQPRPPLSPIPPHIKGARRHERITSITHLRRVE